MERSERSGARWCFWLASAYSPTSIYLAQRGYKTANLPLVPGIALPPALLEPHRAKQYDRWRPHAPVLGG